MEKFYKKYFVLTDSGAKGLKRATVSSFFVYCASMIPAFLIMLFSDELILNHVRNKWVYVIFALIAVLLIFLSLWIEYDKLFNSTYRESANLRIEIAETLSELPLSYFSKNDLSDLSQSIMADVEAIEHAMSHSIPKVGGMIVFFPVIAVMMLIGNLKMGLAVIVPTLISFLIIPLSKNISVKANKKYFGVLRKNSESFQEAIELQQEIKSYNLSDSLRKSLFKQMEESEKIHVKTELSTFLAISISNALSYISLASTIIVGANLMINGEIDVLYMIGYLLASIKIKDALDASREGILEIYFLSPRIERIREIRNTERQKGRGYNLKSFDIEIKNVSFSYDENTPVLKNISFKANQGEVTALVGPSGCGKTSILKLISRLYDCNNGEIIIDGKNIQDISTKSLFSKISIVFQNVTLFNTSIMENIRLGRKDASDEEVIKAAEIANCTDFIGKMEKGIYTVIGENGAELSGGERQRISIARAILKNSPILILDEISASLDVDNEKKIQESLNKLIENKTVIIISHRMRSIENVDKIVVLKDGKVENEGDHLYLLENSPSYRNLIEKTKMAEDFVY